MLRALLLLPLALLAASPAAARPLPDREAARFARCAAPWHATCVIDGDTFRYRGARIRLADINAPEAGTPHCAAEARLAARVTARLTALLNAGGFTLAPADRPFDAYGRRLAVVTRRGASLGAALVAEGLAERWKGYRGSWCRPPTAWRR